MECLTVKQVAGIKGCSQQYIRKIIGQGKITAIEAEEPINHRIQYLIPIETLPEDLRQKYYASIATDGPPVPKEKAEKKEKPKANKPFEAYNQKEREEIMQWCEILEIWQQKRNCFESKVEGDRNVVGYLKCEYPDKQISVDILYRKYAAYKAGDFGGLLDGRGGWNRGKSAVPGILFDQFLWYYLDDRQPSVSVCYRAAIDAAREFYPELVAQVPSEQSFRRKLKKEVPEAVVKYLRKGEKACFDSSAPYIERLYDQIEANDVWIADNHTWDVMVMRDDGSEVVHRMYLTAFLDAKSGVLTGWNVTDNPCSDSTIFALRHGILRHGIPKVCYFDNGTEFLTYDIAGRGHRTRKSQRDVPKPETILAKLGIEMKNAIVRNAKAKPIERTFYTLKEHISKLMTGYCGGKPSERPESLKRQLKNGNIPVDSEFRKDIDALIEGQYNLEAYGGSEQKYKGMTRLEVWNESIQNTVQRIASEDDLNLMLMRTTRYQKVKRNGVCIEIAGEKLWYSNADTWQHVGNVVYVRYDPTDLKSVRVYDTEDRFLYTCQVEPALLLNFIEDDKEALADANEIVRSRKKAIRNYAKGITDRLPAEYKIDMLDLSIRKAKLAREGVNIAQASVIEPIRIDPAKETDHLQELPMASGADNVVSIDIERMNARAEMRKRNKKR